MKMLFIDKVLCRVRRKYIFILFLVSGVLSHMYQPYHLTPISTTALIKEFYEDRQYYNHVRGAKGVDIYYRIKIQLNDGSVKTIKIREIDGKMKDEKTWQRLLNNKYAKINYWQENDYIRSLELVDSSFTYIRQSSFVEKNYHQGPMPFAIFATIGAICAILLLRYMYLLIFATDEKREQVFGDKNFNPFK